MAEGTPNDMWTPFKHLQSVIDNALTCPRKSSLTNLEVNLKNHKQNLANILKNPQKNEEIRSKIRKGTTEGIDIPGQGHTVLSKYLVDESIILSDMYDMKEIT